MIKVLWCILFIGTIFSSCSSNTARNPNYNQRFTDKQIKDTIISDLKARMKYAASDAERDIYKVRYNVDSLKRVTQKEGLKIIYNDFKKKLQADSNQEKSLKRGAEFYYNKMQNADSLVKDYYYVTLSVSLINNGAEEKTSVNGLYDSHFKPVIPSEK